MRPAKSSILHFVSRVGVSVIGFLGTIYLTRELGADVYGTYAVVLSVVSWANLPAGAVSRAIEKRVSEAREEGAFLGAGFALIALVSALITFILFVFRDAVTGYAETDHVALIAFLTVGMMAYPAASSGLSGQRKVGLTGVIALAEQVARVVFQVALVFVGLGLVGAMVGYGVSSVVALLLALVFYDVIPALPERRHFEELFSYIRYSWLGGIQAKVAGAAADVILLKLFVATSFIAAYRVSWNLAALLVMISSSIRAVLFPEVSTLAERGDYAKIRSLLEEGLVFSGLFVVPGFAGAALLGSRILRIYGPEFTIGGTVLVVLIIARMISSYGSQFVSVINGVDRPDLAFRVNLILVVSNIGLNLILIPLVGWTGAAIGTAIAASTTLLLGYYYLEQLVGAIRIPVAEFAKQVGSSAVMALVILAAERVIPWHGNYGTVVLVALGAVVYVALIIVLSEQIREKAISLLNTAF